MSYVGNFFEIFYETERPEVQGALFVVECGLEIWDICDL